MFKIGDITFEVSPASYETNYEFTKSEGITAVGIPYASINHYGKKLVISFQIDTLQAPTLLQQLRNELSDYIVQVEDMNGVKYRCLIERFSTSRSPTLVKNNVNKAYYEVTIEFLRVY
ncbi:MAG: hypothetical protein AB7E45_02110 [Candidatus Caldatribacteriota bacterium]